MKKTFKLLILFLILMLFFGCISVKPFEKDKTSVDENKEKVVINSEEEAVEGVKEVEKEVGEITTEIDALIEDI